MSQDCDIDSPAAVLTEEAQVAGNILTVLHSYILKIRNIGLIHIRLL